MPWSIAQAQLSPLMPQSPSTMAGRVLCLSSVPLRPQGNSLPWPQATPDNTGALREGASEERLASATPPLNNVTNRCLQAEVWSKQSLNYNKVSHSAVLIAMKTAIKCVKKGKCFPRRHSEMLQGRGGGVREAERGRSQHCRGKQSPILSQKMLIGRGSQ